MENDNNNKEEIAHYIGKKILKLRKSKKLSREKFAEKTNLSPNYIYEIEKGNSIPGCIAIINICNFCEIPPANLFEKYLDLNINTFSELTNTNFQKLSVYDKQMVIDIINLLANRNK